MKRTIRKSILVAFAVLLSGGVYAQDDINPIQTAVPSLRIAPDARGGGMGDAGIATAPDLYSQHWNPAKYAFAPSRSGVALSYTPWLRKVVNDIALVHAVGYYKIGNSDNQAISASVRYFTIGDVDIRSAQGVLENQVSPYELAIDFGYSRKLTETFSGSVTIRYIRADYAGADEEGKAGNTFAADIAGYNESYVNIGNMETLLSFGFNISNIGGKISNNSGLASTFIPTNLGLGVSLMLPITEKSTLSGSLDLNKLLVPTPPKFKGDNTPENQKAYEDKLQKYYDRSAISGIFKSFGDAPGGFSEEMKEITYSAGLEYDYDRLLQIRTGYFHENKMKGNRRYFSFGAGVRWSGFQLDAAYLLSTANSSPLDQTLRFSLGFDIDGIKKLFR